VPKFLPAFSPESQSTYRTTSFLNPQSAIRNPQFPIPNAYHHSPRSPRERGKTLSFSHNPRPHNPLRKPHPQKSRPRGPPRERSPHDSRHIQHHRRRQAIAKRLEIPKRPHHPLIARHFK